MCGIFGGFGVSEEECKTGIKLINRGDDGITIKNINQNIIFAARRHLVKKSGNDTNESSDQPYFSKNKKISLKAFKDASISGLLFHGFYLGGVFFALSKGISASLIALIVSLQPILTSILAKIFLKETLSKLQWMGIGFGLFGALIIITSDIIEGLTIFAFFAGLIGLISSSLGIIWQKKIGSDLPLLGNNFLQASSASIFHLFLALCFEDYFINFSNKFILAMSWQIFAVSLGAFLILMWLLKHNKANQTSTLFFLVPPVSALMAFIILNEQFSYCDLIGLSLSCVGVFIVTRSQEKIS